LILSLRLRTSDSDGQRILVRHFAAGHVRIMRLHDEVGGAAAHNGADITTNNAASARR
jgi:hypothetical protein